LFGERKKYFSKNARMSHFRKSLCKVFYIFSHCDDRLPIGTESRQTKTQNRLCNLKKIKFSLQPASFSIILSNFALAFL